MRSLPAILLLAVAPAAHSQGMPSMAMNPPAISVTGQGEHSVKPDKVTVQLAVDTRARTASRAGQDNADRMTAVRKALRDLGLPDSAITTAYYQIHFEMAGPQARDTQYVATNSVRVETRRLEMVSKIIDTSLQSGATTVSSVNYSATDTKDAMRQALAEAVADARAQAEALAAAAGGKVGELLEMSAQQNRPGPIPYMEARMAMAGQGAETPITPGDITVSAIVNARWRFVPGGR